MNAQRAVRKNGDELTVGFLSARASQALDRAVRRTHLSGDDRQALSDAALFLEQIAEGASIATMGAVRAGISPSRSIAAFDIGFGPLEVLKQIVKGDADIDQFFHSLAGAVRSAAERDNIEDMQGEIRSAQTFFQALHGWVLDDLQTKRPRLGARGPALP